MLRCCALLGWFAEGVDNQADVKDDGHCVDEEDQGNNRDCGCCEVACEKDGFVC